MNTRFLRRILAPPTTTHEIVIRRPIDVVYGFCRDLTNAARYVGDVDRVQKLSDKAYRWHVTPFGVTMSIVVTVDQPPHRLRYNSGGVVAGFARGEWEFEFLPDKLGVTLVREKLHIPLGGPGRLILAMVGKFPDSEVRHNLARIKTLLEQSPPPTREPQS